MEELKNTIVSCESVEYLHILFPGWRVESEFDPFSYGPCIFTGPISSKIVMRLRGKEDSFVVWTESGGEMHISREKMFSFCTRRRRNYKPEFDNIELREFLNLMRILKVVDVLPYEEDESNTFELFVMLSQRSKMAYKLGMNICEQIGPHRLIATLMTFYSKVVHGADFDSTSQQYALVLRRAGQNSAKYRKALLGCNSHHNSDPRIVLMYLLITVVF